MVLKSNFALIVPCDWQPCSMAIWAGHLQPPLLKILNILCNGSEQGSRGHLGSCNYADYALCLYVEFRIYVTRLCFGSLGTCMCGGGFKCPWSGLCEQLSKTIKNHQKPSTLDE